MRTEKINYCCDECETVATFASKEKARAGGWAIARDNKICYCPDCAPFHRLGGANGKRTAPRRWLPEGWEQLSFKTK